MHVLCGEFQLSEWKQPLSVRPWEHGTRRRVLLGVRGGQVQDRHWLCRVHRLRRRQVLYDGGRVFGQHMHVLPGEFDLSERKQPPDQLSVQPWAHGSRRWDVCGVRGRGVQGYAGKRVLHALWQRHVLGDSGSFCCRLLPELPRELAFAPRQHGRERVRLQRGLQRAGGVCRFECADDAPGPDPRAFRDRCRFECADAPGPDPRAFRGRAPRGPGPAAGHRAALGRIQLAAGAGTINTAIHQLHMGMGYGEAEEPV